MNDVNPFEIEKRLVYEAFKAVKSNKGSAGIDNIGVAAYENNMSSNLYKLWNCMSSGCYIQRLSNLWKLRNQMEEHVLLGIPTIEDRIAQMAAVLTITPHIDLLFHENSYGYRPNKSAHDAVVLHEIPLVA